MKNLIKAIGLAAALSVLTYVFASVSVSGHYRAHIRKLEAQLAAKDLRILELETRWGPSRPLPLKGNIQVPGLTPLDLQKALKKTGHYSGEMDGRMTSRVVDALKAFQKSRDLKPDGVLGPKTWRRLQNI